GDRRREIRVGLAGNEFLGSERMGVPDQVLDRTQHACRRLGCIDAGRARLRDVILSARLIHVRGNNVRSKRLEPHARDAGDRVIQMEGADNSLLDSARVGPVDDGSWLAGREFVEYVKQKVVLPAVVDEQTAGWAALAGVTDNMTDGHAWLDSPGVEVLAWKAGKFVVKGDPAPL